MTRRVTFVISGLEPGGAERQLVVTANALADRDWNVTVVSYLPFSDTSLRWDLNDSNVVVISLNSPTGIWKYAGIIKAARVIRRSRPDILVGFMFHGIMTARIVGRLIGVPVIVSSVHSDRHSPHHKWLMRATDRLTDAVTIMSNPLASQLVDRRIAPGSHTFVIPNAVEVKQFDTGVCRGRTRSDLGITDSQFLWLAAGRLTPAKDYPNLIRAFSTLAQRRADTQLAIAGKGPLRHDLSRQINDLGLSDRIRLLGLRDDMPDLYRASDALVLSSAWEGMPNVVLETMASATPVVATAVGAVPELVTDGESGFVVPPGDHIALADAMERMMVLPNETRQAFGEAGYDKVRSEFSLDRVIDKWEDLFNRLLESKARGQGA